MYILLLENRGVEVATIDEKKEHLLCKNEKSLGFVKCAEIF